MYETVPLTLNRIMKDFYRPKKLINLVVFCIFNSSLPNYYSHFLFYLQVSCYKKISAYEFQIIFDPSIPGLGDLAIPHAILSVNKLFNPSTKDFDLPKRKGVFWFFTDKVRHF
jgi:hypothetical protein